MLARATSGHDRTGHLLSADYLSAVSRREADPLFSEVQRFPGRRVPLGVGALLVVSLGWSLGPSDPAVLIAGGLLLAVLVFLATLRLTVEVHPTGVRVQLFPFHLRPRVVPAWRLVGWDVVDDLADRFGGRGLRWHPDRGWAYVVRGSGGVRLDRSGKRPLYVSSRRPSELADALATVLDGDPDRLVTET